MRRVSVIIRDKDRHSLQMNVVSENAQGRYRFKQFAHFIPVSASPTGCAIRKYVSERKAYVNLL